ncbi:MAG: tRNA preQ1(34) S-adenosylmethionine ribosyltransferase-isomerase QueA [Candidatus Omnitrophota bacterium]
MKLEEFSYVLPEDRIAQFPAKDRAKCRLMVIDRGSRNVQDAVFENIENLFSSGDCLVLNDTKVMPARLYGKRATGGKVEIFVLEREGSVCEALVRSSRRIQDGEKIVLESGDQAIVRGYGKIGRTVEFSCMVDDVIARTGHIPLPPYITRTDERSDASDYQTVYARNEGATASPTAGLHFTKGLLRKIESKGVKICCVTLHASYGTFAPIKTDNIEDHSMHEEYYELSQETAGTINETKRRGGYVYSVGTTTTRVLETCAMNDGGSYILSEGRGYTNLYVYPGYSFKIVNRLITNFHLPKSTLLLLVSAFAGKELIFDSYRKAIELKYRFFSYGDAMLIL